MSVASKKRAQLTMLRETSKINHQLNEVFMSGKKCGADDTLHLLIWTLHNKFGWGQIRIGRLYNDMVYLTECVNEGKLSMEDIKLALQDECKLFIREVK